MFSQVSAWVHAGVDSRIDYTSKRKVLHTNIAALLAIVTLLCYALLFAFVRNPALINVIYTQIPFYPLLALVLYLNRRGRYCGARWLLVFAVVASQVAASLISFGSYVNSYYSYILFALASVVVFPLERWRSIAFIFTLNMGLFLYFEFNWVEPAPALLALDHDMVRFLRQLFLAYFAQRDRSFRSIVTAV